MQQATVQLGKIGVQAIVNTMGVSAMAAFAAVNRIDDFAYTPEQNIGHAMTAMIAQNKGAGKKGADPGRLPVRNAHRDGVCCRYLPGLPSFRTPTDGAFYKRDKCN